jgi:prepilin-type N-terminal cleavage/methylation domain-containing protein
MLSYYQGNNHKHQNNKYQHGFTLIELMISLTIIIMVMAIAIPNYQKAGEKAQTSGCSGNQKVILAQLESYYLHENSYPLIAIADFKNTIEEVIGIGNKEYREFLSDFDIDDKVGDSQTNVHAAYHDIDKDVTDNKGNWYPLDMGVLKDEGYLQDIVMCPKGGIYLVKFNDNGRISNIMCSIDGEL